MASSSSSIDLSGPSFCVVSGASKGIGRSLAVEVSQHLGPKSVMLLLARNKSELAVTASLCKVDDVQCVFIDLSTASEKEMHDAIINALKGRQVQEFSKCIIFHNVGSLGNLAVETCRIENVQELRDYYDLNVFKVISLNTQFLKIFEEIENRVIIVNITSICAIKPMGGMAYYCSGKAAREMYFRVLAEEKTDIKILNYSPGPVETDMIDYVLQEAVNENLKNVFTLFRQQGDLLKAEVTAKRCMDLLLSGKFSSGDHVDFFDKL